jgi:tRNA A37 methylthiotransferase MiaB
MAKVNMVESSFINQSGELTFKAEVVVMGIDVAGYGKTQKSAFKDLIREVGRYRVSYLKRYDALEAMEYTLKDMLP